MNFFISADVILNNHRPVNISLCAGILFLCFQVNCATKQMAHMQKFKLVLQKQPLDQHTNRQTYFPAHTSFKHAHSLSRIPAET